MTLEQVYFIAEIIAAIAVVLSLLYLGLQIKNSRIQSQNDSIDVITRQRGDHVKLLAGDSDLSSILAKGFAAKRKLHPNEHLRFSSYIFYVFVNYELAFRKWKRKEIDDAFWIAIDQGMHWWLTGPGVRKWWKNLLIGGYTEEFNNYVNKKIETINEEDLSFYEKQINFMDKAGDKP
jgi:hypothetical protein